MNFHYTDTQDFLPFPLSCIHSPFFEVSTLLYIYFILLPFCKFTQSHLLPICIFVPLSNIYFPWLTDRFPFCLLLAIFSSINFFFSTFIFLYKHKNNHVVSKSDQQSIIRKKTYEHSKHRVIHPLVYSSLIPVLCNKGSSWASLHIFLVFKNYWWTYLSWSNTTVLWSQLHSSHLQQCFAFQYSYIHLKYAINAWIVRNI